MTEIADQERFERAIAAIDAANADDPHVLVIDGVEQPKELAHAELVSGWVRRLRPDAPEELLLAARGHHIRRWMVPRASFPKGRRAYLRWRHTLHFVHAELVGAILEELGYPRATTERVATIVRKDDLSTDVDVQTLEDALCLVFFETQLAEVMEQLDERAARRVLGRTWRKMSEEAQAHALQLDLSSEARDALAGAAGKSAG